MKIVHEEKCLFKVFIQNVGYVWLGPISNWS